MLDNLVNADLSGLTGHINYNYDSFTMAFPSFLIGLGMLVFFILVAIGFKRLCNGSKSQQYKELLSDMYVVGRIKQLANEDKIDLLAELKEFNRAEKRAKLDEKSLTTVIEAELKEKVADVQEKGKK